MRALEAAIEARLAEAHAALAAGFAAANGDAPKLAPLVGRLGELRFYRRFLDEVSAIEDEMENGSHAARDL
jgi:molecular chaperone HscB